MGEGDERDEGVEGGKAWIVENVFCRKVEVEVEVEVVQVGQVDQEGLYGAARAANHKKMANGQKDKMTKWQKVLKSTLNLS